MNGERAARWVVTEEQLAKLRLGLIRRAPVFDDPAAYRSGVEDTIAAVLDLAGGCAPRSTDEVDAHLVR